MTTVVELPGWKWATRGLARRTTIEAYGRKLGAILDIARRYAQSLGEEVAVVTGRSPRRGRFLIVLGHVLGWGGLALCALGFALLKSADLKQLIFGPFTLGLLMQVPSGAIVRAGRRQLRPTVEEMLAVDKRRPVLLMRSFRPEEAGTTQGEGEQVAAASPLEEALGAAFSKYGPFLAIGAPGVETIRLGGGRNRFGELDWSNEVARWMDGAALLVVVPEDRADGTVAPALGWELETIAKRKLGHKLLVLVPPALGYWPWLERSAVPEAEEISMRQRRWAAIREALIKVPGFEALAEAAPERLMAIHLAADGSLNLIRGPEIASTEDYELALDVAIYGMKCHGRW